MDSLDGQQLLRKDGRVVGAKEALSSKEIIGFYFSAHWCPPCQAFTPILADFYSDLIKEEEPFEIIFVSSDRGPEEMKAYLNECHGNWLSVQHGAALADQLKKKYNITGIPSLIVVTKDGSLITTGGRLEVTEKGPTVFQNWLTVSK